MEDTKLRCVLVLRLQAGAPAVVVAKLDYAARCETHDSHHLQLYGGRNNSYIQNIRKMIENDPPSALGQSRVLGCLKFVQSEQHQLVYGSDGDGVCE